MRAVTWAEDKQKVLNENLMEMVLRRDNLQTAYKRVKANRGAPGVDGMQVEGFAEHARRHWPTIAEKLRQGNYQPGAIKGVSIPKPQGGERLLGIPTIQDRVIQQALSQVLSPLFEAEFSPHSYGYRPGRSAHDALRAGSRYVQEGKTWSVDLDISAFFDEVDHDILMAKISKKVRDKRLLKLIGKYLRSPMVRQGEKVKRGRGTPQGGPLSPLLANIYLDALDKELEARGLSFCRYADDVVIWVGSQRSGERILANLMDWIAKHLKLRVNVDKSGVGRPWQGKFLGYRITRDGGRAPAPASLENLKRNVRSYWNVQNSLKLEERIEQWQCYIRGWWNYFSICTQWSKVKSLGSWMRRHMRKYFWQRWHDGRGRENALRKLKAPSLYLKAAKSKVGAWRMAKGTILQKTLSNARLNQWGLWVPSDFATR